MEIILLITIILVVIGAFVLFAFLLGKSQSTTVQPSRQMMEVPAEIIACFDATHCTNRLPTILHFSRVGRDVTLNIDAFTLQENRDFFLKIRPPGLCILPAGCPVVPTNFQARDQRIQDITVTVGSTTTRGSVTVSPNGIIRIDVASGIVPVSSSQVFPPIELSWKAA